MDTGRTGLEVAVIGIAGRFPFSRNIDEFWKNLVEGKECITFYSDEQLKDAGISIQTIENPSTVKAASGIQDPDRFDAQFFNYAPSEVESMDPQIRHLHEVAWETLEDGGYMPDSDKYCIGLYAGASPSYQWEIASLLNNKTSDSAGWFGKSTLNNKDLLTTRVSYNLDLSGPSITLYTACSTSLIAIDQAYRALLTGQCDIALAGGSTVYFPGRKVNPYQEGMIFSPDGHTRAFDASCKGSVFGEAVALVLLKPLEDAIRDRDHIYSVIIGSATNNDAFQKVAFSAVGVKGQSDVIKRAIHMAGVNVEHIGYVEAHGTGTPMGDTVEIQALTKAFDTDKRNYCAVASVKSNMGHLDVAAGVSGFIKTCLVLKHKQIPASLHIEQPNPQIDFENSPFYINTELQEFQRIGNRPLIAGVESFGVGGSNAHMVLQEWRPPLQDSPAAQEGRDRQLLLLSAKTESALETATQNLLKFFEKHPETNLADTAYTLQAGRRGFPHRRMLVCESVEEAREKLGSMEKGKVRTFFCRKDQRPAVFMFAGLGAQYVNMGRGLYENEPLFREEMDRCFNILKDLVDFDIKEILYPGLSAAAINNVNPADPVRAQYIAPLPPDQNETSEKINQPEISQLAIFIFEYALARLLMGWGIQPRAMIGYSFGEYIAACVAGVFTLEDALRLVVTRGALIKTLPEGAMLSIPVSKEELTPILATHTDVSFAIDNGPSCIVSGPPEAIAAVEQQMKQERILCMRVPANRAIHSPMMEPVFDEFKALLDEISLNRPEIPYIGNVTGGWVSEEEVKDGEYWLKQLGGTVQFAAGMKELLKEPGTIFVEIGPGRDISTLAQRHIEAAEGGHHQSLNLVRHPNQDLDDCYLLMNKTGQMWLWGAEIDWEKFHGTAKPSRISLPTYPFEGGRYWIDEKMLQNISMGESDNREAPTGDIAAWFYEQNWKRSPFAAVEPEEPEAYHCLVFRRKDETGLEQALTARLEEAGHPVVTVAAGSGFKIEEQDRYVIDPTSEEDYYRLFNELGNRETLPTRIIHLWGISGGEGAPGLEEPDVVIDRFYRCQDYGYYSLLRIAKAIGKENFKQSFHITVLTDQMHSVTGEEPLSPEKIPVLSPVMVIPQEYPGIRCRSIDIPPPPAHGFRERQLADRLFTEINLGTLDRETIVAYRGHHRWVQVFERTRLEKPEAESQNPKLRENGVYLMTGGVGKLGMQICKYISERMKCKFIVTSLTPLPPREEWDQWLADHDENDRTSLKMTRIREVEALGGEVLPLAADVGDIGQMRRAIEEGENAFGPINGVLHLTGIVKGETFAMIRNIEMRHLLMQFRSKVDGLLVLERLIREKDLDFCWIMSSLAAVLGGLGFVAYSAANIFMDAYAKLHNRHHPLQWFTVDWEDEVEDETRTGFERMLRAEDIEQFVFCRGGRLHQMLDQWIKLETMRQEEEEEEEGISRQPRPDLLNPYEAPEKEPEFSLCKIWQILLGFEEVGVSDDFLELGGDSLKAITMITKVHKEFNVSVPLTEFFESPTITHLAGFIQDAEEDVYLSIQPVEKKEYYPLSSAQKRIYILQRMEPGSTGYNEPNFGSLAGFDEEA
jgi:acyl transferase domain-containing protein/acyl carrier protein